MNRFPPIPTQAELDIREAEERRLREVFRRKSSPGLAALFALLALQIAVIVLVARWPW